MKYIGIHGSLILTHILESEIAKIPEDAEI